MGGSEGTAAAAMAMGILSLSRRFFQ
jgi:hypothetical protein